MSEAFSQVLGAGRGRVTQAGFDALIPTEDNRLRLRRLTAQAAGCEYADPLAALAAHANALRRPLPAKLLAAVVDTVAEDCEARWPKRARARLNLLGVRADVCDELVMHFSGRVHIWPGGGAYGYRTLNPAPSGFATLCGIEVRHTHRALRGAWQHPETSNCYTCEQEADRTGRPVAERDEQPLDLPLFAEEALHDFRVRLRGRLTDWLTASVRRRDPGALTVDAYGDVFAPLFYDFAAELAHADGALTLLRALDRDGERDVYERMDKLAVPAPAALHTLLDVDDWRWLAGVMPLTAKLPDAARARVREQLKLLLMTRAGAVAGVPVQ